MSETTSTQYNVDRPWEGPITENPCGILGMEFVEYSSPQDDGSLEKLFEAFGFSLVGRHRRKDVLLYRQNDAFFILNKEPKSFAAEFARQHGKCIPAIGFRVKDAQVAFDEAVKRGAKPFGQPDVGPQELSIPAVHGVGGSLIYFVENHGDKPHSLYDIDFDPVDPANRVEEKGLVKIDHLTNNVRKGNLDAQAAFYGKIFGFREIYFFDIKGLETGLLSRALMSPSKNFAIPINEPTEDKSQIQEYIEEYEGEGVQHLALETEDIVETVKKLRSAGLDFLDVPDTYYDVLKDRVPQITENLDDLKSQRILADGDEKGYLLQLFTKNVMGPIFIEIIQRKNHFGFGEGNFQALFDAIERDQKLRGKL